MTNTDSQLATVDTNISKVSFPTVDLNTFKIEDLESAEVMPIELTSFYWTPEAGDSFRVVFLGIETVPMLPIGNEDKAHLNEDGMVMLPCAYFLTSGEDRVVKLCNASKRLVSTLQGNFIKPMTPLLVTYTGKVKNKNNVFSSDTWSVKPLSTKTIFIAEKVKDDISQHGNGSEIGIDDEGSESGQQSSFQQETNTTAHDTANNAGGSTANGGKPRRF